MATNPYETEVDPNDPTYTKPPNETPTDQTGPAIPAPSSTPAAPAAPAAPSYTPYNREQFRDAWMSTGNNTTAQNQLLSQYGFTPNASGVVNLPTDVNGHPAETLDLRIGAKSGQNLAGWTGVGGGASTGYSSSQPAYYENGQPYWAVRGGGETTFTTIPPGSSQNPGGGYQDQVRTMLMQILGQSQQPIDANSAEVKAPFDAASLDAQRQLADEQKALAESQYAEGGGSSSNELQQGIQQSRERAAVGLAGLRGQLMQRAAQMRMGQLQQALALAVQSGDSEAARAVQLQIASMQNALGQAELNQRGSQWNDQYGLALNDAQYQRDRDSARAKAGLPF